MATLRDLIRSTEEFKPKLFDNSGTVSVLQLNVTRAPGTRTILFTGITKDSESPAGRTVQLQFVVDRGEDVSTYVPSISKDRVLVRSSSPFYKFAFQFNNQRVKAQFGRLSPFTVKGTGVPINPKNYPGLDKHLIALVRALQSERLIKG